MVYNLTKLNNINVEIMKCNLGEIKLNDLATS